MYLYSDLIMKKELTCLLVDDDPDDQDLFRYALQKVNLPVSLSVADDGIYAIEKLSDETYLPDVIFVDLNMPRLNGLECIAEIKKISRLANTPVYIYSTAHENQNNIDIKALGVTEYLEKPSDVMELTPMLSRVLNTLHGQ
jgi:CheY-like chemotaxis protein